MESLSSMPLIVSREIVSEISKKFRPASIGNASYYSSSDSDAYQLYLKAIAADPKNARDWAECIKLLEQSVKIDSIFEPSWTYLGHSYLEYSGLVGGEAGFYSRAEESLVRALELNEDSPDAMYYLASLYAKTGKSEASYNMFLKGSQKYPGYAKYFSGLGYVSRYAGKMEESIDAYHKSIGLDSSLKNIVSARMQILKSQIYLGKYREANYSFEIVRNNLEAQGKIPDEKQLFYAGVINMYLEDTLSAIRYFDLSYDNDPGSIWSGFGLAYKAALMNQEEDLAELLISFESRDIIDGERRYRMVHFYTLGGNYEKALEHLEHSVIGGFFNYPYIVNDPLTINLRETERFKDISGAAYSRYVNFPEGDICNKEVTNKKQKVMRSHKVKKIVVRNIIILIGLVFILIPESCRTEYKDINQVTQYAIVIHGGAGVRSRDEMTPELEKQYRTILEASLKAGYKLLVEGGSSVDAVEAAINVMEDSPLFNAGKGASYTSEGKVELDACIMNGKTLRAGGLGAISGIKNPVSLARLVMEKTPHVLLVDTGAEAFAQEMGLDIMPEEYFFTERMWSSLQRRLKEDIPYGESLPPETNDTIDKEKLFDTVGAVALDKEGNLAAATSTGGRIRKRPGRVGDSPIIGASTYANNKTCAVSTTGLGEKHMVICTAKEISALVDHKGMSVQDAINDVIKRQLVGIGGSGGAITLDNKGNIAWAFTENGMYRGYTKDDGNIFIKIYED